jgi:quinohemoprotein ethanol dehydrogenase
MNFARIIFVLTALLATACQQPETTNTQPVETVATQIDPVIGVGTATIVQADPTEWLSHGRTYDEQRYSPLSEISTDNVKDLGLAWAFDLGTSRGIEATPIVHDGVLYVTATWNLVYALDAKTGAKIWEFDPEIDRSRAAYACCDVVNRGVAIWGEKIFTATIDGRLIALDAKTGEKVWDINTVDLSKPYTITGAPRIIKGKVIIGNGGAEYGVRGYFTAYDAETGEQVWRFYTVPGNPENGFETDIMAMAAETWNGEWWTAGGGGTAWDSMAYDPQLDLLYVGVGNGAPWNQEIRSPGGGDNLFLSSIVAVRPDTGEYVWHYQTTPGETWDYTATQHMILADLEIDGKLRKVIMQAPKNGFFYVIDRETGEFISAKNFVPVNWATHIDPKTGRPVEIPEARWGNKAPYLQFPGPFGGHNWHPMAFSPDTGLVYIPAQEAGFGYGNDSAYSYKEGLWNTGLDPLVNVLPTQKAIFKAVKASTKGRLLAWDPVKQEKAWSIEHNGAWNGGVLSTAGNLIFQGTADAHFGAYDAQTGDKKWSFFSQTGIVAAPISYEIDGEQYIAVASGWGGVYALILGGVMPTGSTENVGRVMVFKLGSNETLPELEPEDIALPEIPKSTASLDVIVTGLKVYDGNCMVCHGYHAQSSGLNPNLRFSPALGDSELWQEIVFGGGLAENGMPGFGLHLTPEHIESVRAYVISEANSDRDAAFYKGEK